MAEEKNELQIKLEEAEKKAQDYLDSWKRERADFLNYKKDEGKAMQEFIKFANEAILLEVIDVLDDFEIALKNAKDKDGYDKVYDKFQSLLKKYGVNRIEVKDEFDPTLHEAIETNPSVGGEEKNIIEVRAGYMMNGKVIRPTRVKITK